MSQKPCLLQNMTFSMVCLIARENALVLQTLPSLSALLACYSMVHILDAGGYFSVSKTSTSPARAVPDRARCWQALDVIKQLQGSGVMPIERAQMRLRVQLPAKDGKHARKRIREMSTSVEEDDCADGQFTMVRATLVVRGR